MASATSALLSPSPQFTPQASTDSVTRGWPLEQEAEPELGYSAVSGSLPPRAVVFAEPSGIAAAEPAAASGTASSRIAAARARVGFAESSSSSAEPAGSSSSAAAAAPAPDADAEADAALLQRLLERVSAADAQFGALEEQLSALQPSSDTSNFSSINAIFRQQDDAARRGGGGGGGGGGAKAAKGSSVGFDEVEIASESESDSDVSDSDLEDKRDQPEDEEEEYTPPPMARRTNNRRKSVSAEAMAKAFESAGQKVFGQANSVPTTQKRTRKMKAVSRARVLEAMRNNMLFNQMGSEELNKVVEAMFDVSYLPGQDIMAQGDEADNCYVVDEGQVDFIVGGSKVGSGGVGTLFGELALMYSSPRAATCTASDGGEVVLWAIDRVTYQNIKSGVAKTKAATYTEFLKKVKIFKNLTPHEMAQIGDCIQECSYQNGDRIIKQGDAGDDFYLVSQGTVDATLDQLNGKTVKSYTAGDYFGEIALMERQPRAANCIATSACTCLKINRKDFKRMLGKAEPILRREWFRQQVSSLDIFAGLGEHEIAEVVEKIETIKFEEGDYIIRQGDLDKEFYLIETGSAKATVDQMGGKTVKEYAPGGYFGELALMQNNPRAANVIATEATKVLRLSREVFEKVAGGQQAKEIMARKIEEYLAVSH